jgi:hypothetical protein
MSPSRALSPGHRLSGQPPRRDHAGHEGRARHKQVAAPTGIADRGAGVLMAWHAPSCSIPAVKVVTGDNGVKDIELDEDAMGGVPLDDSAVPVCVSLNKARCRPCIALLPVFRSLTARALQIGTHFFVDPTVEEELCVSSRVAIAVNKQGVVCGETVRLCRLCRC